MRFVPYAAAAVVASVALLLLGIPSAVRSADPPSSCGNAFLEAGEACDDGNVLDGDCCSSTCTVAAAAGTACQDDGTPCTADRCDGAGACVHAVAADMGCRQSLLGKSKVEIREDLVDDTKDKIAFVWKNAEPVSLADFGDPLTKSDYTLCVIDMPDGVPTLRMQALAPAGGTCKDKPCWKAVRHGFQYGDRAFTPDGLLAIALKEGSAAKGGITIKGEGSNLPTPSLPLSTPVIVRVHRSDAPICFEATFSLPSDNVDDRFKSKSDR